MPNINEFDRLYRRTKIAVGKTNGTVRIALNPLGSHKFRVLTHVSVENKDYTATKIRVGVRATGRDHYLDEITSVSAAELCVSKSRILLGEGDVFFAELTGTQNGNQLVMTCVGWTKDLK